VAALLTIALLLHGVAAAQSRADTRGASDGTPVDFSWKEHPSIESGPVRVELRVQAIADLRASDGELDDADLSRFDSARRRIGAAGTVGTRIEYQVERELSGGGWKDVFANVRTWGGVEVQGGHFKLPFGLDENTSSSRLDFVYRSRAATELAPGRAAGVMAHGRRGIVRYEAGLFEHRAAAGRFVVQPWRKRKSRFEDVQAGLAYTASRLDEEVTDLRGDTALGRRFFAPEVLVNGTRHRVGLEARWRPGPFSVQSEVVRVVDERRGQSTMNDDLPSLTATAWYVQGSWALTGERVTKGVDQPRRPLFDGGIGSIQVAARAESIAFGRGTGEMVLAPRMESIPRHGDAAVTLGVNWSPNRWVRVQGNVVRERVTVPDGAAWSGAPVAWSRLLRVRIAL
jgi:phosphate-selective porin OprO and OprP